MEAPEPALRHGLYEDLQALVTGTLFVSLGVVMFGHTGLLTGGTAGVAFLIHYATGWNFGLVFFAINLPFYGLALQRMGLSARDAVAFEDTEHGVAAAVAAGLACVAIPTEMSASHDFSAATVTLPSMQDAVRWALAQP